MENPAFVTALPFLASTYSSHIHHQHSRQSFTTTSAPQVTDQNYSTLPQAPLALFGSSSKKRSKTQAQKRLRVGTRVMQSLMTEFLVDVLAEDEKRAILSGYGQGAGNRGAGSKPDGNERSRWWEWLMFWRGDSGEAANNAGTSASIDVNDEKVQDVDVVDMEASPLLRSLFFREEDLETEGVRERMPWLYSAEKSERSRKLMMVMRQVLEAERKRRKRLAKAADKKTDGKEVTGATTNTLGTMDDALFKAAQKVLSCSAVISVLANPVSTSV